MLDRALIINPNDTQTLVNRASLDMEYHGDLAPFRTAINSVLKQNPGEASTIATQWLTLATRERNVTGAQRALAVLPSDGCREETFLFPRGWCDGRIALLAGDNATAQRLLSEARQAMEKIVAGQPDYSEGICIIGLLDAALGRKAEAIAEGKRAVEMMPVSKDSLVGAKMISYLGLIYCLTGEKNLALEQLEKSARLPCGVTYDDLLFEPQWDTSAAIHALRRSSPRSRPSLNRFSRLSSAFTSSGFRCRRMWACRRRNGLSRSGSLSTSASGRTLLCFRMS